VVLLSFDPVRAASFAGLGDLPDGIFQSNASHVSGDGSTVLGSSSSGFRLVGFPPAPLPSSETFRWTSQQGMQPFRPGENTLIAGVSADGSRVTGGIFAGSTSFFSVLWDETGMITALPFGTFVADISDDGSTVVGSRDGDAVRWTVEEGIVPLGVPSLHGDPFAVAVSSDGSVITGLTSTERGAEGFRWTEAGEILFLGDLPGDRFLTGPVAISFDGSAIVGESESEHGLEAFRWTQAGGMVGLGDLPGGIFESRALDVSGDGSFVIGFASSELGREAFLWDAERGLRGLTSVLEEDFGLDLRGWSLDEATGISNDGLTIVGRGVNPQGDQEAWIAVLPEPSTLLLEGIGVALMTVRGSGSRRARGNG
jgi:uncharacterized membrane protein